MALKRELYDETRKHHQTLKPLNCPVNAKNLKDKHMWM